MASPSSAGLRLRRCCDPRCGALFTICPSCDRGQRYCSDECRKRTRRDQVAAAGRRYQMGPEGRQAHSRRQSAYRERRNRSVVTHQGSPPIATPEVLRRSCVSKCAVCGREDRWIDPFRPLPGYRRRRPRSRPPAGVQKSTFSRDR